MKTFKIGGVHPPQYKLSAHKKIKIAPLPKQVVIFLSQHIGAQAIPVVEKGDEVRVGQLIAKADGFVSGNVHSSVSGKVLKIDDAPDAYGYKSPAIWIDVTQDEKANAIDRKDATGVVHNLKSDEIIAKIKEMGIVGLGGAAFPTHVKLTVPEGKKAEVLIINASECEPYLTADHQLMLEKGKEIIIGINFLMKALQVKKAIIGIENNKPDAIELFDRLSTRFLGLEVVPLKKQYPQGGEKQLIEAVTGQRVPSGKLPIDIGAIVVNVGTTYAVYEAIQKNKPLIERVITVTGKSVKEPMNLLVRIGTPFADIIEMAGGIPDDTGKIVVGGPMMGKALTTLDVPVAKGCSGVLMIPEKDAHRKERHQCMRCAKCIDACPMGLEPYLLQKLAENEMWDKMEEEYILDCIECGCCQFTCPSKIPLLDFVRLGKRTVAARVSLK